jgi:predicted membrane protein
MNIFNFIVKDPNDPSYNVAWHISTKTIPQFLIMLGILTFLSILTKVEPTLLGQFATALSYTYFLRKLSDLSSTASTPAKDLGFYFINAFALLGIAILIEEFTLIPFFAAFLLIGAGMLYFYGKRIEKAKALRNNDNEDS